ncbi:hypothetical protein RJ639_005720 [Escallonia herrerae]|uniref:RING-type E3 ubiquitin transferase n=1 Tax=Escallonia herrerae TaxID=1293975 RepID=A0AA89AYN9_9ASTE|nr:hypothetical protein RJ639_005720 [Escallonia herrerae]
MAERGSRDPLPWVVAQPKSYALSGRIMLSAIVILFVVVVFMVALHIYARWYLLRIRQRSLHRRRSRRQRATHLVFYMDTNNPGNPASANRGLDPSVINSLPVFVHSASTHPDVLECAVCLSEFEHSEKGRLLPKCQHVFHTDCIDMWFQSHSTCPLCRSPVEGLVPVQIPQNDRSDVVIAVGEPDGSEPGPSSEMGSTSLANRRKGLDMTGVRIEVPRRAASMDELRLSSPASQGFKSPGSRLLSLRRILSMNRKMAAGSPSSGNGTSSGNAGTELDVEEGEDESTRGQSRVQTPR